MVVSSVPLFIGVVVVVASVTVIFLLFGPKMACSRPYLSLQAHLLNSLYCLDLCAPTVNQILTLGSIFR